MLARSDDDVLGAPRDEEIGVGDIGAISRVEPAVVEQRLRFCFVAEVAGGRRRTAELEPPLGPVTGLASPIVDDANLGVGQGLAAGGELDRMFVCFACRRGLAMAQGLHG